MTNSGSGDARDRARRPYRALAVALLTLAVGIGRSAAASYPTVLVRTIDTSLSWPPSPDPMGITYIDHLGTLWVSDSEVNEIPTLFTGQNLFEFDPVTGALVGTSSTMAFSNEPTGLTYNPGNQHVYVSDDSRREVFELDPEADGLYGTPDDAVTHFDTLVFGSADPEGIAYDSGRGFLYIVDGDGAEIYEVDPGPNGIFDGVPPAGDDVVASFDTEGFGALDPEGIAYDWVNGHLYLIGGDNRSIFHITTSGTVLRVLDYASSGVESASDVVLAPSGADPSVPSLYLTDRGIDNDVDPAETDGRIYELAFPAITPGNAPPSVEAGPNRSVVLPLPVFLDGTVGDDGLPGPLLSISWSHVSGPGSAVFASPDLGDTMAAFSTAGTYVLRLSAEDGELSAQDEVVVVVTGTQGESIAEIAVAASSDDAEEEGDGRVLLSSTDLELGTQAGIGQTVGMRFNGVPLTTGSSVLNSFIQFQVDESSSDPTPLTIEGEAVDDAATFSGLKNNIAIRPRTAAQVAWNPMAWDTVGEAGPDQRTANMAPVVQEIVSRPGWSAGNSLSILIHGTSGVRVAESSEGTFPPMLHLEFVPNALPTVSLAAPNDGDSAFQDRAASFAASASDAEDGDLSASLVWTSDLDGPIGTGASFALSTLSVGTHTITASATDSGGARGSAQIAFSVLPATPPLVSITGPVDGANSFEGAPIAFSATASDAEEGDLSQDLSWTSDLDGPIGTGLAFGLSTLSLGTHVITASVTDSSGLSGSDQVTLEVQPNTAPSVAIAQPAGGASAVDGQLVSFSGGASDAEEGELSAGLVWTSDLDGPIGSGTGFSISTLSIGSHLITASVTDAGGLSGSDQVTLEVQPNTAPSVAIAQPADGASAVDGQLVSFSGGASDAEEGELSAGLVWTSDLDGTIGSGTGFSISTLSIGSHLITASVTDAGGLSGSDQVTLQVQPNTAPSVAIAQPADGASASAGAPVSFGATASDAEEGDLSSGIVWVSNLDGFIGATGSFVTSSLSVGPHLITASVTDGGGLGGWDQVSLSIEPNTAPEVAILLPEDGTSITAGQPVGYLAQASDAEDGDLGADLVWSSDLDGPIGSGESFNSILSPGVHTIRASVTDAGGLPGTDEITLTVLEVHPVPALPGWGLAIMAAGLLAGAHRLAPRPPQPRRPTSHTSTEGSAAARATRPPQ